MALWTSAVGEMERAHTIGFPFKWGNLAELDDAAVRELGIRGARLENAASSPHSNASIKLIGTRKQKNEQRAVHFKRKGEREGAKQKTRRERWIRRHQSYGAQESNWEKQENRHWLKTHLKHADETWENYMDRFKKHRSQIKKY